jgi:hypothetical protein
MAAAFVERKAKMLSVDHQKSAAILFSTRIAILNFVQVCWGSLTMGEGGPNVDEAIATKR